MASPNTPLGLVFNPLVNGIYSVYNPSQIIPFSKILLTENDQPILTETGLDLLIE